MAACVLQESNAIELVISIIDGNGNTFSHQDIRIGLTRKHSIAESYLCQDVQASNRARLRLMGGGGNPRI